MCKSFEQNMNFIIEFEFGMNKLSIHQDLIGNVSFFPLLLSKTKYLLFFIISNALKLRFAIFLLLYF